MKHQPAAYLRGRRFRHLMPLNRFLAAARAGTEGHRSALLFPVLSLLVLGPASAPAASQKPLLFLQGAELSGGAKERFGEIHHGERVNYVYAAPTGPLASMEATVTVPATSEPLFLHLRGRDDDFPAECPIRITLNEHVLFEGPSGFPSGAWATRRFPIPAAALTPGARLTIRNVAPEGTPGMPPWFMAAALAVGPEQVVLRRDITRDFRVDLPSEMREFPEPLAPGEKPGFAWRGTKGWLWKPEQYLATIPELVRCRMNFLMNCYGSMCDIENVPWGDPRCNRWYEPLPPAKKAAYEQVVRACQKQGITFCFSMNPNLSSSRYVRLENTEDVEALWRHYQWMQDLGVKWFNISLDDITRGIDAKAQAAVVNEFLKRLRARDPQAQMIFCPTWYWGDGTDDRARPYLEELSRELHPDVYLFWTGDGVVGPISRKMAESYRSVAKRRLFLWDNYPVNDANPTMHLGPVMHRDADLNEVIDGYMANPLHSQTRLNLIPTFTCADYAWNPRAYDPERSIGQVILHLEPRPEARRLLKDLVEAYSGMLVFTGKGTGFNAVRDQYVRLVSAPHSRHVGAYYLRGLEDLARRFRELYPEGMEAEQKTLADDVDWIRKDLERRYGE